MCLCIARPLGLCNLNFWLSSLDSEEFTTQISGFSAEVNGQRPFAKQKSTRDASKVPEGEGEKPKVQVIRRRLMVAPLNDPLFAHHLIPIAKNKCIKLGRVMWQIWAIVSKPMFLNMSEKGWTKDGALNGLNLCVYFSQSV